MALELVPPQIRLVSLEPICNALLDALQADLDDALTVIESTYTDPVLALPRPDPMHGYSREVVQQYVHVQNWPFVSVFSGQSQNVQPSQQQGGGQWRGAVYMRAYLQNSDPQELTLSLDRFAAALWLVALNADVQANLAGARIDYGSVQLQPDPGLGVGTARAVEVRFNVFWRV